MEIRLFFLRFTIPHQWMHHPLKFGSLLCAFAAAWASFFELVIPLLRNEEITLSKTLIEIAAIAILTFLVGYCSGVYQRHRIQTIRKQYVDKDTLLVETATRKFVEFVQVKKTNLAGEFILSSKRLQFHAHSKNIPDPSFNSSLADIQSAKAEKVHGQTVLSVCRKDETFYLAVVDPQKWATSILNALQEYQLQDHFFD